jgi:hypothetical protein
MTKSQQALVSFAIRIVAIAAVAVLDYVSAGLSNGTFQLPLPAVFVPIIGLVVSEADTWLVQWEKTNEVVPQLPPQ